MQPAQKLYVLGLGCVDGGVVGMNWIFFFDLIVLAYSFHTRSTPQIGDHTIWKPLRLELAQSLGGPITCALDLGICRTSTCLRYSLGIG